MDKTRSQSVNAKQVEQFLADAKKRTRTARKNLAIDTETAFQIAYEAMIKGSLALMLSHGQRPRKQLGHHIAIIEFAQKHLPGAKAGMFSLFDRMRRKRNDAFEEFSGGLRICDPVDKDPIDLDGVERQLGQIAQRRITGTEIVQSEGVKPSRGLLNKLLLFWVKSAADAQVRGARIAKEVHKQE